jgi:DNA-binding transcriptional ArsR family regulator
MNGEEQLSIEESLKITDALSHVMRISMLVNLAEKNKSFTQLVDDFDAIPSTVNHHLKVLEEAKLVENFWKKGSEYHSFYKITPRAHALLETFGITKEKVIYYKKRHGL